VLDRADDLGPGVPLGRPEDAGLGLSPEKALARVRKVGYLVLAIELVIFVVWSAVMYDRFSFTNDGAGDTQAWFLIAHGHLDPFISAWHEHFIADHGALIIWLLAPFYWIWPHGVDLLWAQDLAVVVGQAVAFAWICETVAEVPGWTMSAVGRRSWVAPVALASLGLALLVLNPWVFSAISFDVHSVVFGACTAILTAYDLAHHNRRFWLWALLTAFAGDVASTYLIGIFISGVLAGKAWRRDALTLGVAGIVGFGLFDVAGFNHGDQLGSFLSVSGGKSSKGGISVLLKDIARAPFRYASEIGSHWLSIIANLWPAGGIGVACAWGFGVPLVVVCENDIRPTVLFSDNTFQSVVLYLFVSLGTIMILSRMVTSHRRVTTVVGVLLFASTLGWAISWIPRLPHTWLRITPQAAAVLHHANNIVPFSDQVAVEQGTIGAFAVRPAITILGNLGSYVTTRHVWFVIAPDQGIQTVPVDLSYGVMEYLTYTLHAKLVLHGSGVWVYEWTKPHGVQTIAFPDSCAVVPAWALPTRIGSRHVSGPADDWTMTASGGGPGYIVYGDYARLPVGSYQAAVSLNSNGPLSVEVWDADRNVLLARREVPSTNGRTTVDVPFQAPRAAASPATEGFGPFRIVPIPPPPNDRVEVRVFSPAGAKASVDTIALDTLNQSTSATAPYNGSC
jgi:hypothetical protein